MIEPVVIQPEALYDDRALRLAIGLTSAALSRARKCGELRFTRQGNRTLYLGRWIIEWLSREVDADEAVVKSANPVVA